MLAISSGDHYLLHRCLVRYAPLNYGTIGWIKSLLPIRHYLLSSDTMLSSSQLDFFRRFKGNLIQTSFILHRLCMDKLSQHHFWACAACRGRELHQINWGIKYHIYTWIHTWIFEYIRHFKSCIVNRWPHTSPHFHDKSMTRAKPLTSRQTIFI